MILFIVFCGNITYRNVHVYTSCVFFCVVVCLIKEEVFDREEDIYWECKAHCAKETS